jgi:hypothetical protein
MAVCQNLIDFPTTSILDIGGVKTVTVPISWIYRFGDANF